jgi:hypothetical protein
LARGRAQNSLGNRKNGATPPKPAQTARAPPSASAALRAVVSSELARAIIAHRKAMRKPLTTEAAVVLAAKLAEAPTGCGLTPDQAAEVMLAKGWAMFDPDQYRRSGVEMPHEQEMAMLKFRARSNG